jgi:hypothetical protein
MKKKPDIRDFNQKDPTAFLEGGEADKAVISQKKSITQEQLKPEPVVQKLFRLKWDLACKLKQHAASESVKEGRRVTETEVVERLIRMHIDI